MATSTVTPAREQGPIPPPERPDVGPSAPPIPHAGRLEVLQGLAAFAIYLLASVLCWTVSYVSSFSTRYAGHGSSDSMLYRWFLTWTPWALEHGLDPIDTHKVFAPTGTTLAWSTFIPGPALVLWPVTAVFGSLVAYNVAMTVAPALAGWAAYLVARRSTHRFWPAVAGGAFYGWSAFMVGQMHGHINLVLAAFPVPLAVYLVIRRVEGSIGRVAFAAWLTVDLLFLFLTSTEIFATATVFGAIGFVVAWLVAGPARRKVAASALLAAVALTVTAALLFVPYILPVLRAAPPAPIRKGDPSIDLLSLVIPTKSFLLGGHAFLGVTGAFTASPTEDSGYLGIVLLGLAVWIVATAWRRREVLGLAIFTVVVIVFALGPRLHVGGRAVAALPTGQVLERLPLIQNATPQRFVLYASLAVGVLVAGWLARLEGRRRWIGAGVTLLALLAFVPRVPSPPWHPSQDVPAFFSDGTYRTVLTRDANVYVIPGTPGEEMLWQSVTDFWFRMPEGYVGPVPSRYAAQRLAHGLSPTQHDQAPAQPSQVQDELRTMAVDDVLVSRDALATVRSLLLDSGLHETWHGGGVSIWTLRSTLGRPSGGRGTTGRGPGPPRTGSRKRRDGRTSSRRRVVLP